LFIGASTVPDNFYIVTGKPIPTRFVIYLIFFLQEYLPEGTVYHLLHKQNPPKKFSQKGVVQLALQVARGMAYLHYNRIIHRDLKSLNLLVLTFARFFLLLFYLFMLVGRQFRVQIMRFWLVMFIAEGRET
jgi:hypothetical protein